VSIRPDILRNPNLPASERTVTRWFDVGAFAAPQAGAFGTSSRGVIKGPPINVLDAGLCKTFRLTETLLLRGELTAVNVLNHPNWSNPSVNLASPTAVGRITSIGGVAELDPSGARTLRMGVRLEW
jgi:hypothetical protein